MNIVTEYTDQQPLLIALCVLLGVSYAFILYRKARRLSETNKVWVALMAIFRATAVAFLAFFLLGPLIKSVSRETEKPVIVIAHDNSESLRIGNDSSFLNGTYQAQLDDLVQQLSENYDVQSYTYGDQVQSGLNLDFSEKQTNMSNVFDEVYTRYSNRNLGAVVFASDGIYNTGTNPVYASRKLKVPVYSIALGDTSVLPDAVVTKVAHNQLAYLGNQFPMEVLIEARQLMGQASQLRISRQGKVVFSQDLTFTSKTWLQEIPVQLEAEAVGLQKYKIEVLPLEGEVSLSNNVQEIFIDVLDSRQKVLLLSHTPHPDIAALKEAISANENYEVASSLVKSFEGNLDAYSLVILHQIPAKKATASKIINELLQKKIPSLFILGSQSDLRQFNEIGTGISVTGFRGRLNESGGHLNKNFTLFSVDDKLAKSVERFPPLATIFGALKVGNSVEAVFQQKIGSVRTEDPLIAFNKFNDTKTGIIAGEGIWRWRIQSYAETQSHEQFNTLITKVVQYLASKEDKSLFRVFSENTFLENETITFQAELYNESYELINDPDVTISIRNEAGNEFPFSFSKTSTAYRLDAGQLPVGDYSYEAKVTVNGQQFTEKGEFSIGAVQVELAQTTANHHLLYQLANRNGGELLAANELSTLPERLATRDEIVPVVYAKKELSDLINFKWIFYILLALLSFEWFLRKRNGAY